MAVWLLLLLLLGGVRNGLRVCTALLLWLRGSPAAAGAAAAAPAHVCLCQHCCHVFQVGKGAVQECLRDCLHLGCACMGLRVRKTHTTV
jgi:hypothetical protein